MIIVGIIFLVTLSVIALRIFIEERIRQRSKKYESSTYCQDKNREENE